MALDFDDLHKTAALVRADPYYPGPYAWDRVFEPRVGDMTVQKEIWLVRWECERIPGYCWHRNLGFSTAFSITLWSLRVPTWRHILNVTNFSEKEAVLEKD